MILDKLSKESWTKNSDARDAMGLQVHANDPTAVCWCLSGIVWLTYRDIDDYREASKKIEQALEELHPDNSGYVNFNDDPDTTWEMVEQLVKRAGI